MKLVRTFLCLSISFSLAACSSTTMIRSSDPEAKIFVDGEYKGMGSTIHSDQKIVGSTTMVRLEKDGCEPQTQTFSRNEEFDVGACIGGCLVLVPFLWIQKYKAERTYDYKCVASKK